MDEQGIRVRPAVMKPKRSEVWRKKKKGKSRSFISSWHVCQMRKSEERTEISCDLESWLHGNKEKMRDIAESNGKNDEKLKASALPKTIT